MQLKDVLQNSFRPINETELELVWQWRNLPHIRQNMHNDSPISWQEHLQWFQQLQQATDKIYLILWQNNHPAGTLYFTARPANSLEWGCYLGAQNLWPGTGLLMESAALDYAARYSQAVSLQAEVLSFNFSVLKMHRLFGYNESEPVRQAGIRHDEAYDILRFDYTLERWHQNRAEVLARLPKQIAAAANLLTFEL